MYYRAPRLVGFERYDLVLRHKGICPLRLRPYPDRRGVCKAYRDGRSHSRNSHRGKQKLLSSLKLVCSAVSHDGLDSFLEIRARYACCTEQRRLHVELANFENTFGISLRIPSQFQHFFVAGTLSLINEPHADPPNQGVKPEDRFDQHVESSS